MVDTTTKKPYTIGPDDKKASLMVYTISGMYWGDIIVKERIRVSTWLRTNASPDHIHIFDAHAITSSLDGAPKTISLPAIHIATPLILAYHLVPPAIEPLDYDSEEPNRRMQAVTVFIGMFRMDGLIRLSSHIDFETYLEVSRENLISLYEAEISCPSIPGLGVFKVHHLLFRKNSAVFALTS